MTAKQPPARPRREDASAPDLARKDGAQPHDVAQSLPGEVGALLPSLHHTISRLDLVQYAGASGDFNLIHWSDEAAEAVGLPGVIAHGMYSMAVATRLVTNALGAQGPGALQRLRIRFAAPIQPGSTLVCHGRVAAVGKDSTTIALWANDEHEVKVLSRGEAQVATSGNSRASS